MPSPGDLLTLTIERPAVGGPMIGRVEGQVVLVANAIPGERVSARIDRISRHVAFATAVDILDPSADRRPTPGDPLCGGCLYSHIAYPRQVAIKRDVVADAFSRIGRLQLPAGFSVVSSPESGYRMRARLHVRGRRIGFFREGSHDICDARRTRQLLPETLDALDRVMANVRSLGDVVREIEVSENIAATDRVVNLETSEPIDPRAVASLTAVDGLTPAPYVTERLTLGTTEIRLRRHVLAFFQGNRYLLEHLVAYVAACIPRDAQVVDLYAGSGVFSVAAAALRGANVVSVEGDRYAADDLHANVAVMEGRIRAITSDVEEFVAENSPAARSVETASPLDMVIVDPPRTGLSPDALAGVVRLKPRQIVYVSCDVATLARDSRKFVDGGYTIERADGFDLFPNTPHVETVVTFRSRS